MIPPGFLVGLVLGLGATLLVRLRFLPRGLRTGVADAGLLALPPLLLALRGRWTTLGELEAVDRHARTGLLAALVLLPLLLFLIRSGRRSVRLVLAALSLQLVGAAAPSLTRLLRSPEFVGWALGGAALLAILAWWSTRGASGATARRAVLTTAVAVVILCFAVGHARGRQGRPLEARSPAVRAPLQGPNLVLIVLDTLRRDHFTPELMPGLSRFAQRATTFSNAYASSPYTLSSHASLFTGRLPSVHGAHGVPYTLAATRPALDYPLLPSQETLAETLSHGGYDTGAIVANDVYLHSWTGLHRGFAWYDLSEPRHFHYVPLGLTLARRLNLYAAHRLSDRKRRGPEVVEAALEWLARPRERPFFLFVNFFDAHTPYFPPTGPRRGPAIPASSGGFDSFRRDYAGEVAFLDTQVARLLTEIDARGFGDNTLIVVTSDHGEMLGEYGRLAHGSGLEEPLLRIPLVVRAPRQASAATDATRIGLHEVHWLIRSQLALDVTGAPAAAEGLTPRVLSEWWATKKALKLAPPDGVVVPFERAIFFGRYKLIERAGGTDALFDLESDPGESRSMVATAEGDRLRDEAVARVPATMAEVTTAPVEFDAALRERLQALGYVE